MRFHFRLTSSSIVTAALALLVGTVGAVGACDNSEIPAGPVTVDAGGDGTTDAATPPEPFKATIRRTAMGVPHIQADDFGGVGYGTGYAFADDNLCILSEELVTSRGERAKFFGEGKYDLGQTSASSNIASDATYRMLASKERIAKYRDAQPAEVKAAARGFAAGVSRYVREIKAGQHPGRHADCRGKGYVREITDEDLYARVIKLGLLASSAGFINGIAAAKPTAAQVRPPSTPKVPSPKEIREGLERVGAGFVAMRRGDFGSNMYAFGTEVTGGGGIQFGNPHFPWYGGERLYQMHLTVPGKMNIEGATLYGLPFVLIGFNENFAWSHTVSTAYRFTPYALTLKPGDRFTYLKDGQEKKITPRDFEIEVLNPDGTLRKETMRLYESEYGPMIFLGSSVFDWTDERAFTIRDANLENVRLVRNFYRWNTAKSLDEFKKIHAEETAVPWVNTTAADKDGNVYYGDVTVVPNVTDELAKACEVPLLSKALANSAPGLALLDGSKSSCDWIVDPTAAQPGAIPASKLPKVERKDWVVNCNDSYWLTNTKAPVKGFPKIVGFEEIPQSLRSRMCHTQVLERVAGTDGLPGTTFTTENVRQITVGSRVFSAEKFLPQTLTALCTGTPISLTEDPLNGKTFSPAISVDTAAACAALTAWDKRTNPDSKGSLVWDEFWPRVEQIARNAVIYKVAFDPANPVETPRDLDTALPSITQAFGAAIKAVADAGFAVDAARSAFSWREGKNGERIPVPGGQQRTGNFTIAQARSYVLKPNTGYGPLNYGNSYMQVVGLKPGSVEAYTFVTYSESTDPASPHFDDYTREYSQKKWLKAAFTEAEIAAEAKDKLEIQQP
ncbi:MAG: penicillin acylase family protein [Deltaproteobacteria bacterium]|nr:penicillin acylase family protein [Deltaproteobacteria bacterium]